MLDALTVLYPHKEFLLGDWLYNLTSKTHINNHWETGGDIHMGLYRVFVFTYGIWQLARRHFSVRITAIILRPTRINTESGNWVMAFEQLLAHRIGMVYDKWVTFLDHHAQILMPMGRFFDVAWCNIQRISF